MPRLNAVKLLTIGEFARASRLSPKALRLYDELGLLRPVRVDEYSGYRYYSPDQLDQARLVAWLRRAGPRRITLVPAARRPAHAPHRLLTGTGTWPARIRRTRRHSGSKGPATGT